LQTISIAEAARRTGYARDVVRKWLDAGLIPYRIAPHSGHKRICPDDLRRFVESWEVFNVAKVAESSNVEAGD